MLLAPQAATDGFIYQPAPEHLQPTLPPTAGFPGEIELVARHHRVTGQTDKIAGILPCAQHVIVGQRDALMKTGRLQSQQHVAEVLYPRRTGNFLIHRPIPGLPVTGGLVENAVGGQQWEATHLLRRQLWLIPPFNLRIPPQFPTDALPVILAAHRKQPLGIQQLITECRGRRLDSDKTVRHPVGQHRVLTAHLQGKIQLRILPLQIRQPRHQPAHRK